MTSEVRESFPRASVTLLHMAMEGGIIDGRKSADAMRCRAPIVFMGVSCRRDDALTSVAVPVVT